MATRRLRWHGPTRREACRARVQARVDAWQRDWCIGTDAVVVASLPLPPAAGHIGWWIGAAHAGASAWLGRGASNLPALGARMAGQGSADAAGLAERLALRALDDLLARLLDVAPGQLQSQEAPGAHDMDPRHGAIGFVLSGPLADHCLVLNDVLCDALVPPERAVGGFLAPRASAVLSERVSLEVALPLGEQSLSESVALRVGEVLMAGPLAAAQVRLLSASGRTVATGSLARSGDQRALRIEHREKHQGKEP